MTMQERRTFAEQAFTRELSEIRKEHQVIAIPNSLIPKGAALVECYETEKEYVVIGQPNDIDDETDPNYHNCDAMGCSSLSHVVARFPKP